MVFDSPGEWTRKQWIAIVLLGVFAVAMLPPVLWLVNEPTLVAGYPLLYLWSVGWSLFAIFVLWWASTESLFGISDEQTPPELTEQGGRFSTDGKPGTAGTGPSPDEPSPGGDQ